jgi:hypothetical protein
MSGSNDVNPAAKRPPLQKRLYLAGTAVLLAALIAAALIYANTPRPTRRSPDTAPSIRAIRSNCSKSAAMRRC